MKHIKSWFKVAWLVIFLWSTAPCVFAATYKVTDLGVLADLAGQPKPVATISAVNMSGKAVGMTAGNAHYMAFIYGGARTNLGTLGGTNAYALGINNSNSVCGYSTTTNGLDHAFRWMPGSTDGVPGNLQMKDLGTLGGDNSQANGINSTGQICGYSDIIISGSTDAHAFLYSGNTMTDIGTLLGSKLPNSYGYGINAAGHVAGTAYDKNWSRDSLVAFFYNGTTNGSIGMLPGGLYASALALNDSDQIVGYAATAAGFEHAFHYFNGTMTDLGTLGGNWSYGTSINNSNTIVGGSYTDSADSIYHAFICISNTMVDLNTQLDASSNGWVLVSANGINDAGQIVGSGRTNGVRHGFLLTPLPPPQFQITSISVNGSNVTIGFPTVTGATYHLEERTNLITGSGWSNILSGIAGNGLTLFLTHTNGKDLRARFYRVGRTVP